MTEQGTLGSGAESPHRSLTNGRKGGRAKTWQHPSLALLVKSVDAGMEAEAFQFYMDVNKSCT